MYLLALPDMRCETNNFFINFKNTIIHFFMKKILVTLIVFSMTASAWAQQKTTAAKPKPAASKPAAPALKTTLDSLSYAIGVLDGNFFKMQGVSQCNENLIGTGFNDALNNRPAMSPQVADQLIRRELQNLTRKKIQPNIEQGKKFLEENRKKAGIVQTASGLQYEVIKQGSGPRPSDSNVVKIHYVGTLINGKQFESSRDRGEPITYPLAQFIPGWIEGLQLMPVGSRYKFYIPYQLGYGEQGSGETIPGGSTLIFDVELLEIVK
jgi:FKBP-type peptidyl-prolyl cis-trans isomerase FklB